MYIYIFFVKMQQPTKKFSQRERVALFTMKQKTSVISRSRENAILRKRESGSMQKYNIFLRCSHASDEKKERKNKERKKKLFFGETNAT